jgi:hypothetical protein
LPRVRFEHKRSENLKQRTLASATPDMMGFDLADEITNRV